MLQWILGRFDFSQNLFEMRLAKYQIEEAPLNLSILSAQKKLPFTIIMIECFVLLLT